MDGETKKQLKAQAGFAPYEKRLERWTHSGAEYRAWCPWHEQSHRGNPSLAIYRSKTVEGAWDFKCMSNTGCANGDVFNFVQLVDKLPDFRAALQRVAEETPGFKAPEYKPFEYDATEAGKTLWMNPEILAYLKSRGIDGDTARKAHLGVVDHYELGAALAIPYKVDGVLKFRALAPKDKNRKFRHVKDKPSERLLYGSLDIDSFDSEVYVTESELDCLMLKAHGYTAVSVSSATTCVDDKSGDLKIHQELLDSLGSKFEKIILLLDSDDAGRKCAAAFKKHFPKWQIVDVFWEYEKGTDDPKDIGEVYATAPADFRGNLEVLVHEAKTRPPEWMKKFHTVEELPSGEIESYIDGILEEGITFIGSLSGVGKSLFAFSMSRALTQGKKFLGAYNVPKPINVLYLCPEMGARALRIRAKKFGLGGTSFRIATMADGVTDFDDPLLAEAIREMKPIIFLDTAIRFTSREDENSASENAEGLAKAIFRLINLGAKAIVALHHSQKCSDSMPFTKENMLRGTGDIGAMCDNVWGIRWDDGDNSGGPSNEGSHKEESKNLTRLFVKCLKPRDIEPTAPFRIQGRPCIDDDGDFLLLDGIATPGATGSKAGNLVLAIRSGLAETDPTKSTAMLTDKALAQSTGMSRNNVKSVAKRAGWVRDMAGTWIEARSDDFPTHAAPESAVHSQKSR